MKKCKKIITSLLLSVCMIFSVLAITACNNKKSEGPNEQEQQQEQVLETESLKITYNEVEAVKIIKNIRKSDTAKLTLQTNYSFNQTTKLGQVVDRYNMQSKTSINFMVGEMYSTYENNYQNTDMDINESSSYNQYILSGERLYNLVSGEYDGDLSVYPTAYYSSTVIGGLAEPEYQSQILYIDEFKYLYDEYTTRYLNGDVISLAKKSVSDIEIEYLIKTNLIDDITTCSICTCSDYSALMLANLNPKNILNAVYTTKTEIFLSGREYSDGKQSIVLNISNKEDDVVTDEVLEVFFIDGLISEYRYTATKVSNDINTTILYTTTYNYDVFDASMTPTVEKLIEINEGSEE